MSKPDLSPIPPLEIPHKTRDSHIPTAPATADRFHTQQRKAAKIEEVYRFSLRTDFSNPRRITSVVSSAKPSSRASAAVNQRTSSASSAA
jgi:hypothetical protein